MRITSSPRSFSLLVAVFLILGFPSQSQAQFQWDSLANGVSSGTIEAVFALEDSLIYMSGAIGITSADSGSSLATQATLSATVDLHFVNADTGWAIGTATVFVTGNGPAGLAAPTTTTGANGVHTANLGL